MERRWTTRTELCLHVDVASATSGMVGGCRTRDIGLGGVYLEAGSGLLESGETVELLFKLPSASSDELHKLRAKVVRITEGGAGLMFRDFDAIAFRSLQKVMRARGAAL